MLVIVIILGTICGVLVAEIFYLRNISNYLGSRYDGVVSRAKSLVKKSIALSNEYEKTLCEHLELLALVEGLLTATSKEEFDVISDRIYILMETSVSRRDIIENE